MKVFFCAALVALIVPLAPAFCKAGSDQSSASGRSVRALPVSNADKEAEIAATLAKLKTEDRRAVEAQKFCPIMTSKRLGAMGAPIKLTIKNQPVFVCCKGCAKRAMANPDKTLVTVTKLKAMSKPVRRSNSRRQNVTGRNTTPRKERGDDKEAHDVYRRQSGSADAQPVAGGRLC